MHTHIYGNKTIEGRQRSPAGAMEIDDLIDDLVELILLRIPCRAGLVRSAATCKRWRRLIAGAGFLRRFRSVHGPPQVVGHYYVNSFLAAFLYTPPTLLPREIAIDVGSKVLSMFHFDLPYPTLTDSRGGLVAGLLHKNKSSIVVFSPWIKQHKELQPPLCRRRKIYACLGAFLLDVDEDTAMTMSHFKVLCVHILCQEDDSKKTVEAHVYSARDGGWLQLSTTAVDDDMAKPLVFLGRAGGSLFWFSRINGAVFHLNEVTGMFASLTLPRAPPTADQRGYSKSNLRVFGAGDGSTAVRLVRIVGDVLDVFRPHNNNNVAACVLETRLHLSQLLGAMETSWRFVNGLDEAADRVFVISSPRDRMFIADVDNMTKLLLVPTQDKISRVPDGPDWTILPYEFPWPPIIL